MSDQEPLAREALRQKCRESQYFLAKSVLGFADVTTATHLPMCKFLGAEKPGRRSLILAPRSTFKSTLATVTRIVWRIIDNPEVRILLVSNNSGNATKFLRMIQDVWERNLFFRTLFPELLPPPNTKRWNETEMMVPRTGTFQEATVEAIGVDSTVVSRHYDHIHNDDLIDEQMAESQSENQKAIDFYKGEESLLVKPTVGTISTVGTHWGWHDPYMWMKKHEPGLALYYRNCRNEDGSPYFPEWLPETELQRLQAKYGTWKFACLYENNPRDPDSNSFRDTWLRYFRLDGDLIRPEAGQPIKLADCYVTMRVDPAISESSRAARTAIVVDAVAPDQRKFLLDVWAQRCQPFEAIDTIFSLADRWLPVTIGIESVAFQRFLTHVLEAEAQKRGRWLNVIEMRPDTRKSKEARIRAIQPYLERGEIWVQHEQSLFLDEYRAFPVGTTVDVLDAWAYGPWTWQPPLEAETDDSEREHWYESSAMDGRNAVTGY